MSAKASFCDHAVQSAHIDRQLATELSRTESLRIKADYTGAEIELAEAVDVVQKAELFVQTVGRVFGLEESSLGVDSSPTKDGGKVSEPDVALGEDRTRARMKNRRGIKPHGAVGIACNTSGSG